MRATNTLNISTQLADVMNGLPGIAGWESQVLQTTQRQEAIFLHSTNVRLESTQAAFAVALHMHQPTIPAGRNGQLISNLQYMFEHPNEGDNHNAGPFVNCYRRMGDIIPELVSQG